MTPTRFLCVTYLTHLLVHEGDAMIGCTQEHTKGDHVKHGAWAQGSRLGLGPVLSVCALRISWELVGD